MVLFEHVDGATPIEDASGLIPELYTKAELDEWEAVNILKAIRKYLSGKGKFRADIERLKKVHKDMFDDTWKWAGKFRDSNVGIGVDWPLIPEKVKNLIDDIKFWGNDSSGLTVFEQSIRIHHRLVSIHPFKNGNGRHARLMADIFLRAHNEKLPDWPDFKLIKENNMRDEYIKALKEADRGNYDFLEGFTKQLME
jgi:Fic-DOC domain mobile mystery protein B